MTDQDLSIILPQSTKSDRDKYLPYLNKYWDVFEVNTSFRKAAFIAQVGHESGQLKHAKELWGPTKVQLNYEFRKDLGNTTKGDGFKFRGHGLIQVTGRENHKLFDQWLHKRGFINENISVIETPEIISNNPEIAVLSAFWYWERHKLNELSDLPK